MVVMGKEGWRLAALTPPLLPPPPSPLDVYGPEKTTLQMRKNFFS